MALFKRCHPTTSFSPILARRPLQGQQGYLDLVGCLFAAGCEWVPLQFKLQGFKMVCPPLCTLLLNTNIYSLWLQFNAFNHTFDLNVNHNGTLPFTSHVIFKRLQILIISRGQSIMTLVDLDHAFQFLLAELKC